jgi:uncharacterized Zn finger protein
MVRRRDWGRGDYGDRYGGYGRWAPYVPVAQRRAQAIAYAKTLERKQGRKLAPVKVAGRAIATSFWGQAWCANLEAYSDFANRLPRGRTYVRNGSVIDLSISKGQIAALVSGSEVYNITISIGTLPTAVWKEIQRDCARSIASLIDLLQGRFDQGVMQRLTRIEGGLFPKPKEIKMQCSCPDSAGLCKHLAAVLYGVGAQLDHSPELLFTLRNVDHLELIGQAVAAENLDRALAGESEEDLQSSDLGEMFGIELESGATGPTHSRRPPKAKPRGSASSRQAPKARRATAQHNRVEKRKQGSATVVAKATVATLSKPKQVKGHGAQVAGSASAEKKRLRAGSARTSSQPRKRSEQSNSRPLSPPLESP